MREPAQLVELIKAEAIDLQARLGLGMATSSLVVVLNALRLQGFRIRAAKPWTSSTFSYP